MKTHTGFILNCTSCGGTMVIRDEGKVVAIQEEDTEILCPNCAKVVVQQMVHDIMLDWLYDEDGGQFLDCNEVQCTKLVEAFCSDYTFAWDWPDNELHWIWDTAVDVAAIFESEDA